MNKVLCEKLGLEYRPELDIYEDIIPKDAIFGNYSQGEFNPRFGTYHSEETKEKIRLGNLGKKMSKESIEKNRLWHTGKKYSEETNAKKRAYRHTNEAIINISKNHYFAKNGRPGHGEKMREFYKQNPDKSFAGKTWVKDSVTGKRVWTEMAQAY